MMKVTTMVRLKFPKYPTFRAVSALSDLFFLRIQQQLENSAGPIMAVVDGPPSEAGPSSGPHRMRITAGGSMPAYIRFALSFLNVSLVLGAEASIAWP